MYVIDPRTESDADRIPIDDADGHSPGASTLRMILITGLGGGIEFFDFVIYGLFAPSIAAGFFPSADHLSNLLDVFAILMVGYLVRPIGGIVFSHFGDRWGRPTTFLVSIMGISLASIGMAVCPTYEDLGSMANVAFVLLRLLQGLCLGGEIPGALTYIWEVAPLRHRGLACSLLFSCLSFGVLLAHGTSAVLHHVMAQDALVRSGWRYAFAVGGILGLASYLPRRRLQETAAFQGLQRLHRISQLPLAELRRDVRRLVGATAVVASIAAFNGLWLGYLPIYLVRVVQVPPDLVIVALVVSTVFNALMCPLGGWLSDRVTPRVVLGTVVGATMLASWPFFRGLSADNPLELVAAFAGLGILGGLFGGSFAPLVASLFPTEVRFTGIAVAYNVAFATFSGLAPLISTLLLAATGSLGSPALYLCFACLITVWAMVVFRNTALDPTAEAPIRSRS